MSSVSAIANDERRKAESTNSEKSWRTMLFDVSRAISC
jgi:hypothetical protein